MGELRMDLYLKTLRWRYHRSNRAQKKCILDDFCKMHGYHRKAAARLLRELPISDKKPGRPGKKKTYDPAVLIEPLKKIWLATDQMCGKRLKHALPLWLPHYHKHHEPVEEISAQLLAMSAATIDRLLKPIKSRYGKGLSGTKPGSLLRKHIPISTNQWDTSQVGFMEADTVAHCGTSLMGDFVWSITMTDIFSGWTEMRATWNKGATGVMQGIQNIEEHLPFEIKGFDCDNGSEFLNWHLIRYFTERTPNKPVQFTRSRPYKKDDNAHVEQKNWTHVRQLFGYHRFDKPKLAELMNDLYANEISLLYNFFYPCIKLIDKVRIQSSIQKKYDKPQTPYQRLMASNCLTLDQKKSLQEQFITLDPFDLQEKIQKKLKLVFRWVNVQNTKQRKAI
ncbi:Integrase core domain [Legionella waltersii]|nr:DDE-type integrase/transposase/recombinase [Legionella waltersii]SNV03465.1 Integrase core domain [Legionella waltersii]SNV04621.1 Integrase core domain [Legionella waltersii]SNV05634.1 Integrase core domain [Legionella waltersii]SNV05699.1 Integrase core domain [Legionella waltersii]SNV05790.1 Integrase core domain [Legionella waltersii]